MENENSIQQKSRTPNFTATEKQLLFSIIHKHKDVIENKKTDGVTNEDKVKSWNKVVSEFNASCPERHRSLVSLKKLYYNKKKEIRKSVAEETRERYLTGGGVIKAPKPCPDKDLVLSIMNEKTTYGFNSSFDSDCVNLGGILHENGATGNPATNTSSVVVEDDHCYVSLDFDNEIEANVGDFCTPSMSKQIEVNVRDFCTPSTSTQQNVEDEQPSKKRKFDASRRRPSAIIKALTSSAVGEKYSKLVDYRLVIAEAEVKWQAEHHALQRESMLLDIEIKKETLKQLRSN